MLPILLSLNCQFLIPGLGNQFLRRSRRNPWVRHLDVSHGIGANLMYLSFLVLAQLTSRVTLPFKLQSGSCLTLHVASFGSAEIPTVTDNLFMAGTIGAQQIAIYFEPVTNPSGQQLNGEITWGMYMYYFEPSTTLILIFSIGRIDLSKIVSPFIFTYVLGNLFYLFIVTHKCNLHRFVTGIPPSNMYWGINQHTTYGSETILSYTAGVLDCGA